MDRYVTGAVIRRLREGKKMTQEELAERIHVSGKAVSKWETGQGFPDISLIEPLAEALGISVIELLSGACIRNRNQNSNIFKSRFYVCPLCGNAIWAVGESVISCCGITLPPHAAEAEDEEHGIRVEPCVLRLSFMRDPSRTTICMSIASVQQGKRLIMVIGIVNQSIVRPDHPFGAAGTLVKGINIAFVV